MRLSRLGTDNSLPPDYQGFRGRVRVGPIDPRGGSAEQLPAHQTDRGCKTVIEGAAATAESGGATRAALLAIRAHRGTGSSNPLPSSGESGRPQQSGAGSRRRGSSPRTGLWVKAIAFLPVAATSSWRRAPSTSGPYPGRSPAGRSALTARPELRKPLAHTPFLQETWGDCQFVSLRGRG